MLRRKRSKILILSVLIICSVVIYINLPRIYVGLFDFLSYSDEVKKSDIIFCVSGELTFRLPLVLNLYKRNLADKMVFTTTAPSVIQKRFINKYYGNIAEGKIISTVLQNANIDTGHFVILPNSVSSITDIVFLKRYYSKHPFKSMIVVTSPYHRRRLRYVISKIFANTGVRIYFYHDPSEKDYIRNGFNEKKDYYVIVSYEIMKYIYYRIIL